MFISVVVAVRNERRHIQKCLESLFRQKYDDYEVIVVDGMSDDGTYETLKKLQEKYKFKLFRNEKKNAAAGRNIGIKEAKGDAIAFIDGDAIAAEDWLKNIKEAFEESGAAAVGGPDLLPNDSSYKEKVIAYVMTSPLARGGKLNPATQHAMMNEKKYVEHIPTCNLCIKRDVFEKVGLFDENFVKGQDLELNYRIRKAGYKIFYSPSIKVVHYRKQHIRHFARQIYKWAKAKVAIIKKHGFHGITSHIYLWPAYAVIAFFLLLSFCVLFNLMEIFLFILFILGMTYIFSILLESARLTKKRNDKKFLIYAAFLFPIAHFSYGYGVLIALMKKKIW